jgi:ABC-type Fe3+-hydroxamate transport system substrate-binding protein
MTLECGSAIPAPAATVTDACGNSPLLNITEQRINGSCPAAYSLIRTYNYANHCGLGSSIQQRINVVDTTPPVLHGVPANMTGVCTAPAIPTITVTDYCGIDTTYPLPDRHSSAHQRPLP